VRWQRLVEQISNTEHPLPLLVVRRQQSGSKKFEDAANRPQMLGGQVAIFVDTPTTVVEQLFVRCDQQHRK